MVNVGLAACSTLILGWVCLLGDSALGGWTGGGFFSRGCSSSRFTESIKPAPLDVRDKSEDGRTARPLAAGSFSGGAGASSTKELSPRGPSGSVVSSTASSLVTWALTFRGVLGPRRVACAGVRESCAGPLGALSVDGPGRYNVRRLEVSPAYRSKSSPLRAAPGEREGSSA